MRSRVTEIGPLLRKRYGQPVRRIGILLGTSCPNRDGTLGTGGCLFCAEADSASPAPVAEQLAAGLSRLAPEHAAIAYLQDHTATHLPAAILEDALRAIQSFPQVVGVAVGTRPDALPPAVLAALERGAERLDLLVELGLQSADDEVLRFARRRHNVACFSEAVQRLHQRGLRVSAHVILGLPKPDAKGALQPEGAEGSCATARLLDELGVDAVKVHNCHVLRDTALADHYKRGLFCPPDLPGYLERLVPFIEHLPSRVEVHRLCAEALPSALLAPKFTADKNRTLQRIRAVLEELDTWQGRLSSMAKNDAKART